MFHAVRMLALCPRRKTLVIFFIITANSILVSLAEPHLQKYLINDGLYKANVGVLIKAGLIFLALGQVLSFLDYVKHVTMERLRNNMFKQLLVSTTEGLLRRDIAYAKERAAAVIAENNKSFADMAVTVSTGIYADLLSLVLALGFCMSVSWQLTSVLLCLTPGFYFFGRKLRRRIKATSFAEEEYLTRFRTTVARFVAALWTVRIFGQSAVATKLIYRDFDNYAEEHGQRVKASEQFSATSRSILSGSNSIFLLLVGIFVTEQKIKSGRLFCLFFGILENDAVGK